VIYNIKTVKENMDDLQIIYLTELKYILWDIFEIYSSFIYYHDLCNLPQFHMNQFSSFKIYCTNDEDDYTADEDKGNRLTGAKIGEVLFVIK
jgi:hypothetical protein